MVSSDNFENVHQTDKEYTKRVVYDYNLLKSLNEEYKNKPYMNSFPEYSDDYQLQQAKRRLEKINKLYDLKNKKLLEVGCGGGYVSYVAARDYNCTVVGTDIYESPHWENLKTVKNLSYVQTDFSKENLFENESFDLIMSFVAWEHIRHPFKVLQQCTNLIKQNGHMYIYANLYRSAIASHLYRHIFFPWPHLLFDDEILIKFALDQGVEQWWIDAFYHVNKLTYCEYKDYFNMLGLALKHENLVNGKFDWDFYNRFEDKLGLYPIKDLELSFFHVLLAKENENIAKTRLVICEVELVDKKDEYRVGDKITVKIVPHDNEDYSYAYYLESNNIPIFKQMYTKYNTLTITLDKEGVFYVKGFIKDSLGNKTSHKSLAFEVKA